MQIHLIYNYELQFYFYGFTNIPNMVLHFVNYICFRFNSYFIFLNYNIDILIYEYYFN